MQKELTEGARADWDVLLHLLRGAKPMFPDDIRNY